MISLGGTSYATSDTSVSDDTKKPRKRTLIVNEDDSSAKSPRKSQLHHEGISKSFLFPFHFFIIRFVY